MTIKLEDAVAVVQKEIRKWREEYESVANEDGQDHPIIRLKSRFQAVLNAKLRIPQNSQGISAG